MSQTKLNSKSTSNEDVDALYEAIYGRIIRPNIYSFDDEEYLALRNEILSSRRRIYKREVLPFEHIPQAFEAVPVKSLQRLEAVQKSDGTWTFKYKS